MSVCVSPARLFSPPLSSYIRKLCLTTLHLIHLLICAIRYTRTAYELQSREEDLAVTAKMLATERARSLELESWLQAAEDQSATLEGDLADTLEECVDSLMFPLACIVGLVVCDCIGAAGHESPKTFYLLMSTMLFRSWFSSTKCFN